MIHGYCQAIWHVYCDLRPCKPETLIKQIRPMETALKKCGHCAREKLLSEFGWQNHATDILRKSCKECDSRAEKLFGIEDEYEARRSARLFLKYGISPREEAQLLADQNGACAACGEIPEGKRLLVDYCKEYNVVRGLLCPACSKMVGRLGSDLSMMRKTMAYLQASVSGF